MFYFKVKRFEPCPALYFDNDQAGCGIAHVVDGMGEGCCIKARAFRNGKQYDFASLNPKMKKHIAQSILYQKRKEVVNA